MRARKVRKREGRDRTRGWIGGAVLSAALLTAGCAAGSGAVAAQEPEPQEELEECVCLDPDEIDGDGRVDARRIRARVRRSLREAEEARKRSVREVERARHRIQRLQDVGTILESRARLGVEVRPEQPEEADVRGVRVAGVGPESPAAEAGLEEEDVIVAVDGRRLVEPLADAEEEGGLDRDRSLPVQRLTRTLADREPGDTVRITYLRDGEEHTTPVELGSFHDLEGPAGLRAFRRGDGRPPVPPRIRFRGPDPAPPPGVPGLPPRELWFGDGPLAGIRVQTLGPELGQYFGATEGVLVLDVVADAGLGLRPGDVVLAVGSRDVQDEDDFRRILRSYESGEEVELRIRREDRELTVTGAMP
ncbi:MAG: PDZ domain-containing protein [Longimicrobiales bacterium]|nr:PDZ domain-containing protein [Longimicrobiales bacterium]